VTPPAATAAWPLAVGCAGLSVTLALAMALALTLALAFAPESAPVTVGISVGALPTILPAATVALTASTSKLLRPAHVPLVHRKFGNGPGSGRLVFVARE
jgi:hypothetical protein